MMKYPNVNIFAAWFFLIETLGMVWVADAGNLLLQMLGVPVQVGFIPGRIAGALLLLFVIYLCLHFLRSLPPQGNPQVSGFNFGHRMVLAANILACVLYVFQYFESGITDYNTHMVLEKITNAFGYFAIACFAFGFSFIYQSSLPQEQEKKS
jgi:hypothetical protein